MRSCLVLTACLGACAAAQVPHRFESREIELTQRVRFVNVPNDARLVLEGATPDKRVVLANRVSGAVEIPFAYEAHENVENGEAHQSAHMGSQLVSIQAPGYLPRTVIVSVPSDRVIDAALLPVALAVVSISPAGQEDFDAGLERALSGRCGEATPFFERAKAVATGRHEGGRIDEAIAACHEARVLTEPARPWEPSSADVPVALVESPQAAVTALKMLMVKEHDKAGQAGLDRLVLDVQQGRLTHAAKLAALIAAPLPAKRAALVLRLPRALLALGRLREAQTALVGGDPRGALELATQARQIDPLVVPRLYTRIREARVDTLVAESAAVEASNPLLARAYLRAAWALAPQSTIVKDALDRTAGPALSGMRLRVAVVASGASGELVHRITSALPLHVEVVGSPENADAVLELGVDEVRREHHISTAYRTTEVRVGTVSKPNPDYASAQERVHDAEQRLDEARNDAAKLRAQSADSANQIASSGGGVWGALAAGAVAGAGAGGGEYLVSNAEGDLRGARSELARTPRTTSEVVTQTARYPVITIQSSASVHLAARIDGFPEAIAEQADASATTSTEQVVGSPEIGVSASDANLANSAQLVPDLEPAVRDLGQRLSVRLAAAEEEGAWSAYAAALGRDDGGHAAAMAAAYLDLTTDPRRHADEVIDYLVENLP